MSKKPAGQNLIFALYGPLNKDADRAWLFRTWWAQCEDLATRLGLRLTHIGGTFDPPNRVRKYYVYKLPRARKRFEEEIARGTAKRLEMEAMISRPTGYLSSDADIHFYLREDSFEEIGCSIVDIDVAHLRDWTGTDVLELLNSLLAQQREQLHVHYGFATVMPRQFLTGLYALGIAGTSAEQSLAMDANIWRDVAPLCGKLLRNVFPYNVLREEHLEIRVGSQPLGQWIGSSAERGTLLELGKGLYLWLIAPQTEGVEWLAWDVPAVQQARQQLVAAKIFPWQHAEPGCRFFVS